MQQVIDISWWQIALFATTLLIPYAINYHYKLEIGKDATVGLIRMAIQLALVGLYLEYLFYLDSFAVNLVWLMVMIIVGANAIAAKSKLPKRPIVGFLIFALCIGLFPVLALLCLSPYSLTHFIAHSTRFPYPVCCSVIAWEGTSLHFRTSTVH